ncbi:hypothetical protein PVAP13_9KG043858 [Panicum virgatum]|uniref:Uncharacterized protein n=1 Tax=Panicum virgatum TaxID=38727 RepID=A0A8T0NAI8_PANVG|nr:hypothetical protein PVAP13_9KG043858 [Panicum virgatum]
MCAKVSRLLRLFGNQVLESFDVRSISAHPLNETSCRCPQKMMIITSLAPCLTLHDNGYVHFTIAF